MALRRRHRRVVEKKESIPADLEDGSEESVKASWVELTFRKRECMKFIPTYAQEGLQRCGCGRLLSGHKFLDNYEKVEDIQIPESLHTRVEVENETAVGSRLPSVSFRSYSPIMGPCSPNMTINQEFVGRRPAERRRKIRISSETKWHVMRHTATFPTDAHGILEYQGTGEGDKSQYIRLAHDTQPEQIIRLLTEEWGLQLPKMVITVHGGVHNFQLQPKLRRVFCDGLIKAAKTTGAWIMSFGLNTGVGSIVGNAITEHKAKSRGKIYSIGVAPWGVVDNREDLIGSQPISSYQTMANPLSKGAVLHAAHTHFLLVDNGTAGKYDSELKFRRRLERKLSLQQINTKHSRKIPVVCLVLEGGKNTINVVLESVRQTPPIPVIVVDGSGRAADLLAFAHQYADDDGTMMEDLRVQLLVTIQNTFSCEREQAQYIFLTIMECVRRRDLITVFRLGQGHQDDIDNAILTASLKARRTSAPDMLSLAMTWNRIDIATSQIFVYGQHWPVLSLEQAMMDALTQDRVDFVNLLMENGVSMHKFLTIPRLEELYNIKHIPVHLLYLLQDVKKNITWGCRFSLIEIGQVIESLMGGAYRCNYTRKRFRLYYAAQNKSNIKKQPSFTKNLLPSNLSKLDVTSSFREFTSSGATKQAEKPTDIPMSPQIAKDFQYPFHELMVWAVLMKRQKMALFMWQHGEEAIAKALIAAKLYRAMAKEAADDELDLEEMEELRAFSKEFRERATQLLEICYRADTDAAQHLLTYELKQWSRETCLSLAITAQHRDFIAHPCVQLLLNDLWMGGLNVRKNSSLRVILGLLLPPSLFMLQFKSQEELLLMPQTMEEHMDERNDSSSISSSSSSSLSSTSSSSSSSSTSGSITSGLQPKPEVVVRGATGLDHSNQPPQDAYLVITSQQRQLTVSKKLYEFYNAPITKFWLYTIFYNAFLIMFTYVVLVQMGRMPSIVEWLVIAHTFTLALEKVREVVASEPSGAFHKIKIWMSSFWNQFDVVLLVTFFCGFILRMMQDDHLLLVGRALYCVNIALWYIRLLNIFSVSKYLGPYVMMMGKMMVDLGTFIFILAVVLMSFGVTRQAILHPDQAASWKLVRDSLMEPYFMLYGEVYAGTIDPCDGDDQTLCVVGSWIVPTAMTLYLLVANILLLNMLIAVFNNTFAKVKNVSDEVWKFHRYRMIVEYESRPVLPPPFIIISYLFMIIRLCFKKRKNSIFGSDRGLKLFLDDEDVEKLHDFEEECVDEFFRQRDLKIQKDLDLDVRKISPDRMERLFDYIDDAGERDHAMALQLRIMEERMLQMEEANMHLYQALHRMKSSKSNESVASYLEEECEDEGVETFQAMRKRMQFRVRRIRQDSEMSTASDWHPPTLLMRRTSSNQARERHTSEHVAKLNAPEFKIRKTHSTGNLIVPSRPSEAVASSNTLATISSHDVGSARALSRNWADQEQKSISCQDILIMRNAAKSSASDDNAPLRRQRHVVSGSEFLASDFFEDRSPEDMRTQPWSSPTRLLTETESLSAGANNRAATEEQSTNQLASTQNDGNLSGNERSCSSLEDSDSDHGRACSKSRKKHRSPSRFKNGKSSRSNGNSTSQMPMLVINSPESNKSSNSVHGLTPVEDVNQSHAVQGMGSRFRKASKTMPSIGLETATEDADIGSTVDGAELPFHPSRSSSMSFANSKRQQKFTPPRIQIRQSPMPTHPQSVYKSITDCIDTSRWHDAYSPKLPMTPFEMWNGKPPDFAAVRSTRSPLFSIEGTSQDEWEDEAPTSHRTRRHATSHKSTRRRRHKSRVHSKNSSSSLKSTSSRRHTVRKHRQKRKKRQKDLLSHSERGHSNMESVPLMTLPEASSVQQGEDPGLETSVFADQPQASAGIRFNVNNCNSSFKDGILSVGNEASFLVRYQNPEMFGNGGVFHAADGSGVSLEEAIEEENTESLKREEEEVGESRPLLC